MSPATIIDAGPAHAEIVAALHAATVGESPVGGAWEAAWVARILALPGAVAALALARDAQDPVGFAACLPAGDALDLLAIGVLRAHRRTGVARALLAHCEAKARASGAGRLMLEVAADNAAARAFYRGAGYGETGRRQAYYRAGPGGVPRDALIMSKAL